MPPRIRLQASSKALAFRPKPSQQQWQSRATLGSKQATRAYADASKDLPESTDGKGPNMDQLGHVSEEAAATSKAMGESGPDISQGVPVNEVLRTPYDAQYDEIAQAGEQILKDDKEAQKNLPKVMQDDLKAAKKNSSGSKRSFSTFARQTRQYSTTARRHADLSVFQGSSVIPPEMIYSSPAFAAYLRNFPPQIRESALATIPTQEAETGIAKEDMPDRPLHQNRYDPIVEQMVGLLIRHGKKSVAQRNMTHILAQLRTSPPPVISEKHPLLPGSPAPSHLPLNPVLYLQLVIDSVAPLMRIKSIRGAAGGGMALQLPVPLRQRQRRRVAMKWILDAASKRKTRGSGKTGFAQRVAEELVSVAEGKSSVWERRNGAHKQGVAARANLNARTRR